MDVLILSLARNVLTAKSREYERMALYARELNAFHCVVLTRKEHGFVDPIHAKSLHIYPTNSSSRFMMLIDAFRLGFGITRKMSEERVISAQDPFEIGWFSWLLAFITRARFHVQVHGDYFTPAWSGHSPIRIIRRAFGFILLKHAPHIRVVSKRIYESLVRRGISRNKITILPIRPELEIFLQTPHTYTRKPPYIFLYVGRLAPEKNIPRIIKAFALLSKGHTGITLRIIGEGNEKEKIQALIRELGIEGQVSLQPWTDAVHREMATADVFLLASRHEAYALTLIESLACGVPVIATDVGCVGEIVKDGEHGIVVKDETVESYRDAMEQMIREPARMELCGTHGREVGRLLSRTSPSEYARAWVTSLSKSLEKV